MRRLLFPLVLLLTGNSCVAQMLLSREKAIEDIDYYVRTMKASHYEPFRYIAEDDYNTRIAQIKGSIGDSISIRDFIFRFYEITALLKDAHCTPQLGQPLFREEFKTEQFFPYKLVHRDGKIYAPAKLATDLGIPAGTEIVDINGTHLSTLLQEVRDRIAGTDAFREDVSCKLLCYFMFLKGIKPPFVLGYRNGKASVKTGVPFRQGLSASLPHIINPYDCRILQNKLGYIDVRSLSGDTGAFRSFLDTSFAKFKNANIRTVAIDLRKNSGGSTTLGDLLFSYITKKKYTWGIKSWKISQPYKDYLIAGGDTTSEYLSKPVGTIWTSADDCVPRENRFRSASIFEGKIFFITGPFTFSSAMDIADVAKEYKLGAIVGEPTGENVKDFGEAFVIDLPNSKIKIQSTSSFNHGVNCRKKENGPVMPDVITSNSLMDDVFERDQAIQYILKSTGSF